jgi:hypothetical protein
VAGDPAFASFVGRSSEAQRGFVFVPNAATIFALADVVAFVLAGVKISRGIPENCEFRRSHGFRFGHTNGLDSCTFPPNCCLPIFAEKTSKL